MCRIRSGCWARAASGHVVAAPQSSDKNSRSLMYHSPASGPRHAVSNIADQGMTMWTFEASVRGQNVRPASRRRDVSFGQNRKSRPCGGMSTSPSKADIGRTFPEVRFVPILLQKSGCRRRGTAGAIFEAVRCHPRDCAGYVRSTLLTLATLTQRTKGRTVVAGRPTWQACGRSAQSRPT